MQTKRLTTISMMICLLTVCSWITIPYAVPFTMQTFALFCILLLLGGKDGTITVVMYILLGGIGVPVFSGFQGGIGHIMGPTGGYVLGFVLAAQIYWAFEDLIKNKDKLKISVLVLGLILCYAMGTIWFRTVAGLGGTDYSTQAIILSCVVPYIIPDLLKLALAFVTCKRVKRALKL